MTLIDYSLFSSLLLWLASIFLSLRLVLFLFLLLLFLFRFILFGSNLFLLFGCLLFLWALLLSFILLDWFFFFGLFFLNTSHLFKLSIDSLFLSFSILPSSGFSLISKLLLSDLFLFHLVDRFNQDTLVLELVTLRG